jgi:hypothetical protein
MLLAAGCSGGDREEAARLRKELEAAKAELKLLREKLPPQEGAPADGKVAVAKTQLQDLTKALDTFKVFTGEYPPSLQELTMPHEGRAPLVAASALVDPWGQVYQYDPGGPENQGKRPDVWTVRPGGDKAAKIGNWTAR